MARCEDFPCCGHEAGACPDENGCFPCCECGGTLPYNARSSICESCQRDMFAPKVYETVYCLGCDMTFGSVEDFFDSEEHREKCKCDEYETETEYEEWDGDY